MSNEGKLLAQLAVPFLDDQGAETAAVAFGDLRAVSFHPVGVALIARVDHIGAARH
jgi:hypothetical protein